MQWTTIDAHKKVRIWAKLTLFATLNVKAGIRVCVQVMRSVQQLQKNRLLQKKILKIVLRRTIATIFIGHYSKVWLMYVRMHQCACHRST